MVQNTKAAGIKMGWLMKQVAYLHGCIKVYTVSFDSDLTDHIFHCSYLYLKKKDIVIWISATRNNGQHVQGCLCERKVNIELMWHFPLLWHTLVGHNGKRERETFKGFQKPRHIYCGNTKNNTNDERLREGKGSRRESPHRSLGESGEGPVTPGSST